MNLVIYAVVAICFWIICIFLLKKNRAATSEDRAMKSSTPKAKNKIPDYNWGCIIYIVIVLIVALTEISSCVFPNVKPNLMSDVSPKSDVGITEVAKEKTVYWVEKGKVWHVSMNCSTLARSNNIRSGTIKQSGKSRMCKVCG